MYESIVIYTGNNLPVIYRRVPFTLVGDYIGEGVVAEANRYTLSERFNDIKAFSLETFQIDRHFPYKHKAKQEGIGFNLNGDHCLRYLGDELPMVLDVYYGFYAKELFMQVSPEYGYLVDELANYCILDEFVLSKVEQDWQEAAFYDVVNDIQREAQRDYSLYVSKRRVIRALDKALEECRVEWVYEYNSAYLSGIDVVAEMVRQEMGK